MLFRVGSMSLRTRCPGSEITIEEPLIDTHERPPRSVDRRESSFAVVEMPRTDAIVSRVLLCWVGAMPMPLELCFVGEVREDLTNCKV
jgi:hypothetical protein